jgi:methionyl aminopeptidase
MNFNDSEESEENYLKTLRDIGRITFATLKEASTFIKPGIKAYDIAEKIEKSIIDKGYMCAFPLNLSVNSEAAHYTPKLNDDRVFNENDLIKIDFGIEKEGVLSDCAISIDLSGKNQDLIDASREALENALSVIKAGVPVNKIGKEIEDTIIKRGFIPIKNLGGHGVGIHALHSGIFIPNFDNGDTTKLNEGETIAIEPFATNGKKGIVIEGDFCEIYQFDTEVSVRSPNARKLLNEIKTKYASEPFAVRWLSEIVDSSFGLYSGISELFKAGVLSAYPVLIEQSNGLVAQTEVEVLVGNDSCEVLTK